MFSVIRDLYSATSGPPVFVARCAPAIVARMGRDADGGSTDPGPEPGEAERGSLWCGSRVSTGGAIRFN